MLRFLPREGPLPAKRALIRTRTVALNVTELSTWPTSGHGEALISENELPLGLIVEYFLRRL